MQNRKCLFANKKSKKRNVLLASIVLFTSSICFIVKPVFAGLRFSEDVEAINRTAKSVLMLEVFDNNGRYIGTGSGFVAFNNSTLVTNYHVIEDGHYINANTDDGSKYRVDQVLCSNKKNDIAILSFEFSTNISPLNLYLNDKLLRGETVVAIGSPKGITNTVSKGNISALYEEDGIPLIQFTAPISPGSSGGVLLNDNGDVIGITSGAYPNTQNLNLAIRSIVAQAMYNSWDGKSHSFATAPIASTIDYRTIKTGEIGDVNVLPESTQWTCPNCSSVNTSLFCLQCGKAKPEWICSCGQKNLSPFCGHCGNSIDSLIVEFNKSYSNLISGKYEAAVEGFSNLNFFDSKAFITDWGSNSIAADQINDCYYLWGKCLLSEGKYTDAISKFLASGIEYRDSGERIKEAYHQLGLLQYSKGEYDDAIENFGKANDYIGASDMLVKTIYAKAISLGDKKNYSEAIAVLMTILDYEHSKSKISEYNYCTGLDLLAKKDFDDAIDYFILAGSYGEATERLKEAYLARIIQLIDAGRYNDAYKVYSNAKSYQVDIDNFVIAAPNDRTQNAQFVLKIANSMGFIKKLPKEETIYNSKYIEDIIKMENAFGLNADGVVGLDEIVVLSNTLYPGCKGNAVAKVLERLKDLGFLSAKLPETHNVYDKKYISSVKKAEKALGLIVDAYLTPEEQSIIFQQPVPKPDGVKKLTAKEKNGSIILSWSSAKGAVYYDLYRDNEKIATVTGTNYKDTDVYKGQFYCYTIVARNYSNWSDETAFTYAYIFTY